MPQIKTNRLGFVRLLLAKPATHNPLRLSHSKHSLHNVRLLAQEKFLILDENTVWVSRGLVENG